MTESPRTRCCASVSSLFCVRSRMPRRIGAGSLIVVTRRDPVPRARRPATARILGCPASLTARPPVRRRGRGVARSPRPASSRTRRRRGRVGTDRDRAADTVAGPHRDTEPPADADAAPTAERRRRAPACGGRRAARPGSGGDTAARAAARDRAHRAACEPPAQGGRGDPARVFRQPARVAGRSVPAARSPRHSMRSPRRRRRPAARGRARRRR